MTNKILWNPSISSLKSSNIYSFQKKINNKYNFVKSKDLDSLDIILFITEVEKKFSIKFKKNDLLKKNFQNIDGLSKIIKNI